MQLGAAIQLELLKIAGLDGEQRSLAIGFGKLKARRGLLDFEPKLVRNFLQHIPLPRASVEIHASHHRSEEYGDDGKPASQAVYGERHACSV